MNNQRKFILIAAAIGIVATFLPWVSVSAGMFGVNMSQSTNGFHGIGILYFILLIAAAVVAVMGDQKEMLQKNMRLMVIGAGVVSVICLLASYINLKSATPDGGLGLVSVSVGYGLIIAFLAALGIAIIPFVIKQAGDSFANDLAQLKSSAKSLQENMATATTTTATTAPAQSNKMAELEKLISWRNEGKISEEEYQDMKAKLA